ncbi:TRAP transporter substrate-binding protein DctP [Xanthobacter sp. VNH20]|jgi:TRAP-type C4-dicarboxylate transport system substrate-binding protein|uniref:TRAP transporter substrate-binding protein DctP n=1 Tax=Xanthobacter sp. VNH20 TaxID=3156616 RepID=UPI0032B3DF0A
MKSAIGRFILAAVLGATALAGPARAAETLILPNEVAATHWKTDYQKQFADLVNQKTGGKIDVKVFAAGQLYNEQDALAALGTGAVQMVWPVSVRVETIAPQTGILNLPFAISDKMMTNACFSSGLTQIISSYVESRGLKVLGLMRTADLFFIFSGKEVKKMEDLKGTKVRVTGGRVFLDTMKRLGISPVSMAASEMSSAMSQGAIDGVFSSPAGWAEMIGISGKYGWYVPGFQLSTYAVVVDKGWYDKLAPDLQQAVSSAIDEISKREWIEAKAADEKLIQKMKDQGAKFHVAGEAEIARWRKLAEESTTPFDKAHPDVVGKVKALEASCGVGG